MPMGENSAVWLVGSKQLQQGEEAEEPMGENSAVWRVGSKQLQPGEEAEEQGLGGVAAAAGAVTETHKENDAVDNVLLRLSRMMHVQE